MGKRECQLCAQDISKPSLVRCNAAACPLARPRATVSRRLLMGIAALGLVLVLVIFGINWITASPGATMTVAQARPARGATNGWFDGLWRPRGAAVAPSEAAPTAPVVDWGASKRVETFSCAGELSAARRAVCTNWDLATIDYNLALVYRHALAKAPDRAAMRAEQSKWLEQLDTLDARPEVVIDHYRAQLERLQQTEVGAVTR